MGESRVGDFLDLNNNSSSIEDIRENSGNKAHLDGIRINNDNSDSAELPNPNCVEYDLGETARKAVSKGKRLPKRDDDPLIRRSFSMYSSRFEMIEYLAQRRGWSEAFYLERLLDRDEVIVSEYEEFVETKVKPRKSTLTKLFGENAVLIEALAKRRNMNSGSEYLIALLNGDLEIEAEFQALGLEMCSIDAV